MLTLRTGVFQFSNCFTLCGVDLDVNLIELAGKGIQRRNQTISEFIRFSWRNTWNPIKVTT